MNFAKFLRTPFLQNTSGRLLLIFIKINEEIKGLNFFENSFLYTAYPNDATFFFEGYKVCENFINAIDVLSFSELKPNLTKCKLAGMSLLKEVIEATCRIKCIDLTKLAVKITGTFILIIKKLDLNKKS